jgi:hypothetical protein
LVLLRATLMCLRATQGLYAFRTSDSFAGELVRFPYLNVRLSVGVLPFAAVIFSERVCDVFSVAALQGFPDVAALVYSLSVLIDLATL